MMPEEGVSYHEFAQVYDELMDQVPYEEWADRIEEAIRDYGVSKPERDAKDPLETERNLVLDLGCGTGTLTELLYDKGYDMIGVDNSHAMLQIALEKRAEGGRDILYLLQDMRELELYSTVGTVVSVCDSINYILEEEELLTVFELVNNYLFPRGLFLFDFNTDYKYRELIGDTTIAENREDVSFIWENFYDSEEHINDYDLTLFIREGEIYRKYEETHLQRGYEPEEVKHMLERAGLEVVSMTDADTRETVTATTGRVFVIAREQVKEV